ncbi:type II secretion system protein [Acinetobacter sp. KB005]|uniref:type II secretion system protein n=1 Tax=Acinetobacter sp. KB005 TaxID=3416667 RepID=UPI003CF7258A
MLKKNIGFTLVELLVVITLLALMLSVVLPQYLTSLDKGKETILKNNLNSLRVAIDHYYADQGVYPVTLDILVKEKYIRNVPIDPITQNKNWKITYYEDNPNLGIYDVSSSSLEVSQNGQIYSAW